MQQTSPVLPATLLAVRTLLSLHLPPNATMLAVRSASLACEMLRKAGEAAVRQQSAFSTFGDDTPATKPRTRHRPTCQKLARAATECAVGALEASGQLPAWYLSRQS